MIRYHCQIKRPLLPVAFYLATLNFVCAWEDFSISNEFYLLVQRAEKGRGSAQSADKRQVSAPSADKGKWVAPDGVNALNFTPTDSRKKTQRITLQ